MARPQEVDVQQVMERIREAIRRRRSAEETSERLSASDNGSRSPDFGHLQSVGDLRQVVITSHRQLFGLVVVAVKRMLLKLLTPILERQTAYNAAAVRAMADTDNRMHAMEWRHDQALAASQEQIEASMANLRAELQGEVARLSALREGLAAQSRAMGSARRGTEADVRERQRIYVACFEGAAGVVDLGCGRGEFLELLRESGIKAQGVDVDLDMVLLCRDKGLDAVREDAFAHLAACPDEAVGGIFSAQFIEYLEPQRVVELVKLAHRKLAPGGWLVLETPNPACLMVFADSFYRDFPHVRPIHSETMKFLLEATGFREVEVKPLAVIGRKGWASR